MRRPAAVLAAALAAVSVTAAALLGAAPASAAASPSRDGNDVSYPQCGQALPAPKAFAIVGLNGGTATTDNPCFAEQLAWASGASGVTDQPDVAIYVNTANPGLRARWWPSADVAQHGGTVDNPLGRCTGTASAACAYVYGWSIAWTDANLRGVDAPARYFWWLDVEEMNTWSADTRANRAVLEGMTDYFHSLGAEVGLYSTHKQWRRITGRVPVTSPLAGLPSWRAGARTAEGARALCGGAGFTPGSRVVMTQYVPDAPGIDTNVLCERVAAPKPVVTGHESGGTTAGRTLAAEGGTWLPAATLRFQWTRDGVAVAGATHRTYRTTALDAGRAVAVVVTGDRPGLALAARTSDPVQVAAAPVATRPPTDPTPTASATPAPVEGGPTGDAPADADADAGADDAAPADGDAGAETDESAGGAPSGDGSAAVSPQEEPEPEPAEEPSDAATTALTGEAHVDDAPLQAH